MKDGITYKQRDIVLIPFPYSDLTGLKKRPAVIMSNSKLKGNDFICLLITSNTPKNGILIKDSFLKKSLPFISWVKPQRIFTIDKRMVIKRITSIDKKFHELLKNEVLNLIKTQ